MKDLEEWEPQKSEEQKGGSESREGDSGNPFGQDYKEFDNNSPDQIRDQDIQNWIDEYQENKKKEAEQKKKEREEESKPAEKRAEDAQEKMDKEWCRKHNLDYETLRQYRKIEQEVAPYLEDFSRLWQRIIFGSSKRIERGLEGYLKPALLLTSTKLFKTGRK